MSRADALRGQIRERLGWLVERSAAERALISLASLIFAILVGAVIILVSGRVTECSTAAFYLPFTSIGFCYDPVQIYLLLFNGALGSPFLLGEPGLIDPSWSVFNFRFGFTLKETTLLVFTGLSVAISFRAGLFNIGTQGQLVIGALATALAMVYAAPLVPAGLAGGVILIILGLAVGALFGGLYGAIPGLLKAYADANEVITTIMLNFIAANIAFVLVSSVFRDPSSSVVATYEIPDYAQLPSIVFPASSNFSELGLIAGLFAIAGLYYLLEHTSFGYDIRTSGVQPEAAEYGGVDSKKTIVRSLTISGAFGGIAGALWVLMQTARWESSVPALGFDGITVSILAGNNPLGVLPAALLFGMLKGGAVEVAFQTDVPSDLIGVLRGLIILFVAMPEFFRMIGKRLLGTDGRAPGAAATDGGDVDE